MNLQNEKPNNRYGCSQQELYAICRVIWASYLEKQTDFANFKALYTAQFGNDRIAEVAAAEMIADEDARQEPWKSARIVLKQKAAQCLVNWQGLKRYIRTAWESEPELIEEKWLAAGANYYKTAGKEDWEDVKGLVDAANLFIAANVVKLSANDNMPAGFPALFETDGTIFLTTYGLFKDLEQDSEEVTTDKVTANNAIYDKLIAMCEDGVHIYRMDAAKRDRFVFAKVKELVSSNPGNGGGGNELTFSGTVTDNVTGAAIEAAELIVDGEVIATTNAAGEFTKTFTITEVLNIQLIIRKTGYNDYDSPVQFSPGVDLIQNVQMTPKVGSLSGTVSDAGTAMGIGGASVTITGNGVNLVLIADANGNYSAPDIRVGTYTVTANAPGHLGQSVSVTITENANTIQNFSLVVMP